MKPPCLLFIPTWKKGEKVTNDDGLQSSVRPQASPSSSENGNSLRCVGFGAHRVCPRTHKPPTHTQGTHARTRTHTHTHARTHARARTHTHVHTPNTHTRTSVCARTHARVCACAHARYFVNLNQTFSHTRMHARTHARMHARMQSCMEYSL